MFAGFSSGGNRASIDQLHMNDGRGGSFRCGRFTWCQRVNPSFSPNRPEDAEPVVGVAG